MPTVVLGLLVASTLGMTNPAASRAAVATRSGPAALTGTGPTVIAHSGRTGMHAALATVAGRVTDAVTGEPLDSARLVLSGASLETRTDEEGRFSFEGHDLVEDTLLISHDGYRGSRLLIADISGEHLELQIELRRGPSSGARPALDPVATLLRDILVSSGAKSWAAHEFEPFLTSVGHPLELLLFSGLIEGWSLRSRYDGCVLIVGAEDCATLWLEGRETNAGEIGGLVRPQIERFWVVPPHVGIADLGLEAGSHAGLVVVLMGPEGR